MITMILITLVIINYFKKVGFDEFFRKEVFFATLIFSLVLDFAYLLLLN